MARTIVVCGYGNGISDGVARKFGAEGFQVALVARSKDKLDEAAAALRDAGVNAKAFPSDLSDAAAIKTMIGQVRSAFGPISVVHYNGYTFGAGDLTTSDPKELHNVLDVAVHGLLITLPEALPDLAAEKGAFLVTGGGFAYYDPGADGMAVQFNAMGIAVSKAAQKKMVGLLHQKLKPQGVFVGEVVVQGIVKGTAFDAAGNATLEPSTVGDAFWSLYQARADASVAVG